MSKSENTVPNIWTAQENVIHFYRVLALGLGGVALVAFALFLVASFRDPVVVTQSPGRQEFYPSSRSKVAVGKDEVERFTKDFLNALYVWNEFKPEQLAREIEPFAEKGFVEKVIAGQSQKYGKELKGKKLSQAITFVEVEILEDRVVARFDRVIKIEGIPLLMPTEVVFSMIQGSGTRINPMGIYVSGITEREGAK